MQEHTKKRPTETVELRFIGPIVNMARAIENMKPLGFVDTSDSVPWREAYPEFSEGQLIGKALAGARYREGLTQMKLADMIGIPQRHISEMENGKRPIGKEMAKRLGKALNISYKVFL
jgi:DNA-binding XRE family transcriptional regulator